MRSSVWCQRVTGDSLCFLPIRLVPSQDHQKGIDVGRQVSPARERICKVGRKRQSRRRRSRNGAEQWQDGRGGCRDPTWNTSLHAHASVVDVSTGLVKKGGGKWRLPCRRRCVSSGCPTSHAGVTTAWTCWEVGGSH
jgi:hypothetical protein